MRVDIRAAQKALKQLASIKGHLGDIKLHGHTQSITALPAKISKPWSQAGLKWTSDSGQARRIQVEEDNGKKRVHYVYYGPWTRKHVHSAYLIVFHGGGPVLEVRLSKARSPSGEKAPITHVLRFRARRFKNKPQMHLSALNLVRKAKVEVSDDRAVIGTYRLADGYLQPGPKRVLLNAIVCALVAIDVRGARITAPGSKGGMKRPGKKKLNWKAGQKIEILLDAKFGSQELHEKLIDDIQADLKGLGVKAEREHPYDLVVRKGHQQIVVEAKAWPKAGVLAAAIAATGQLLHYADLFGGTPRLLLALWKAPPDPKGLHFLRFAQVGVLWRSKDKTWTGDKLAQKLLPELLSRSV